MKRRLFSVLIFICLIISPYLYKNFPYKKQLRAAGEYLYTSVLMNITSPAFSTSAFPSSSSPAIPKIIHYVWLGSKELPPSVKKTIDSWKKFAPDYKIKRWDETNCNVFANEITTAAYQNKSYDFVSDWCRFKALEAEGGLYLDTDHLLTASPTPLLISDFIVSHENRKLLSGSFLASVPHHPIFNLLLSPDLWKVESFTGSPGLLTAAVRKFFNFKKLPLSTYFSPELSIYSPNFVMLDYSGSENRAIHLYGEGKTDYTSSSPWYRYFFKDNLNHFYYHISDMVLIPDGHGFYYDFYSKNKYILEKNSSTVIRIKSPRDTDFSYYYCYKNKCYKLPVFTK